MPTARGWLVALTGVGLWIVSIIFGAKPLGQLGFALIVMPLLALAVVRLGRHDLLIERSITPERANARQPVTVTLSIQNRGKGPAPLLLLEDRLPARLAGKARFAVKGIEVDGHRETAFVIEPMQRGRYKVGPLDIEVGDPFGMARIRSIAAREASFLVHPPAEKLSLPRDLGERRSVSVSALRQPTGSRGEDFYTLREYAEGDDLRRIHWPSTAKRGKYMIRQEETPWHTRSTLLLDDRNIAHDGFGEASSFERVVESASSLVSLYATTGYGFKLMAAHEAGVPTAKGIEHLHRCLDILAMIEPQGPRGDREDHSLLERLAEIESGTAAEDTLVLITGSISPQEAAGLVRCRRLYKQVLLVGWPAHRFGSGSTKTRWEGERQTAEVVTLLARSGVRALVLGPGDKLAPAWGALSTGMYSHGGGDRWAPKPELA